MTVKEKLNLSLKSDTAIESYLLAHAKIKSELDKFKKMSHILCDEDVGNIITIDDLSNQLADMEIIIQEELMKLLSYKKENLKLINKLDDITYKSLLTLRYVSCQKWENISHTMIYTKQHLFRLHNAAIKELEFLVGEIKD